MHGQTCKETQQYLNREIQREGARWPSGFDRWLGPATEPLCGKNFSLRNFTPLCQCISDETLKAVGPFYLVSMYARGSKISHQSTLECVNVVDSTSHSKLPQSASMRLKTLTCTANHRQLVSIHQFKKKLNELLLTKFH